MCKRVENVSQSVTLGAKIKSDANYTEQQNVVLSAFHFLSPDMAEAKFSKEGWPCQLTK